MNLMKPYSPNPRPNRSFFTERSTSPETETDWINQQIITSSPTSMLLFDAATPDLIISSVNLAFEQLSGYRLDEVVGKSWRFALLPHVEQPDLPTIETAILRKEATSGMLRMLRKNGQPCWIELRLSPIRDHAGTVAHYIGIQNDLTAIKEAEVQLQFLNQTALEMIALKDEEALYTYIGMQLEHLLPNAIILINKTLPEAQKMVIQGAYGIDQTVLGRVMDLMGYSPVGASYPYDPVITPMFLKGRLMSYEGGFAALASRAISSFISNQFVRLFHLGDVFLMGLQKDDVFYAGVQIYLRDGKTLEYPAFIEAFLQQASTTLQRLQAISSLRESEQRYRSLFEQSNDAVFLLTTSGEFLHINQRGAAMLGKSSSELIGKSFLTAIAAKDHEHLFVRLQRLLHGEHQPPFVCTLVHPDSTEFPAEMTVEIVRDAQLQPLHIQSIVRDITERHQMEADLRQKHEEMNNFFMLSLDLMCIADVEGYLVRVNKAWEAVLGYPSEQIEGKPFMHFVHPDDKQMTQQVMSQLLEQKPVVNFVNRYQAADGSYRFIEWYSRPAGRLIYAVARDITERKAAQERDFSLALEKERIRVLTRFVHSASHELRTPLTLINMSVNTLTRTDNEEKRKRAADRIEQQIMNMTRLLDLVLLMTKLDSGAPFQFEMTDINPLIEQVIDSLSENIIKKRLNLTFHPDLHLPRVTADPSWLHEACIRLLDNAVRYTEEEGSITISTGQTDLHISIAFIDNGIGIRPESLQHIFERFWRHDEARTTPGFGLGLPIAQKIIDQHQGKIEVESRPGSGSCFRILLNRSLPNP